MTDEHQNPEPIEPESEQPEAPEISSTPVDPPSTESGEVPPRETSEGGPAAPPFTPMSSAPSETPGWSPTEAGYGAVPPYSPPQNFASNYPRMGQTIIGYIRPPGVYWDTISTAFSMVTSKLGVYAVCTLIFIAITGAFYAVIFAVSIGSIIGSAGAVAPGGTTNSGFALLGVVIQYVATFLTLCLISVGVKHAQGNFPEISDFFIPFRNLRKSALAALLAASGPMAFQLLSFLCGLVFSRNMGLFIGISSLILILQFVAYVFLYGPLVLSGTATIFNDKPAMENAQQIYRQLGANCLMFGLLYTVAGMASGLGALILCIGILFTYPILTNVVALHYIYNWPEDQTPITQG